MINMIDVADAMFVTVWGGGQGQEEILLAIL